MKKLYLKNLDKITTILDLKLSNWDIYPITSIEVDNPLNDHRIVIFTEEEDEILYGFEDHEIEIILNVLKDAEPEEMISEEEFQDWLGTNYRYYFQGLKGGNQKPITYIVNLEDDTYGKVQQKRLLLKLSSEESVFADIRYIGELQEAVILHYGEDNFYFEDGKVPDYIEREVITKTTEKYYPPKWEDN